MTFVAGIGAGTLIPGSDRPILALPDQDGRRLAMDGVVLSNEVP